MFQAVDSWLSVFSPLQDDPLMRGEHSPTSPVEFGKNQLTYAQGAFLHSWALSFTPVMCGGMELGFMPMQDEMKKTEALGKVPFGPWVGEVPVDLLTHAFPAGFGAMQKVQQ